MRILITGGAGFIGSNFVHYLLEKYPYYEAGLKSCDTLGLKSCDTLGLKSCATFKIIVLDKLTYAGNLNNLKDIRSKITFIKGDICNKKIVERAMKDCDIVINFAAESHVDRSIIDAGIFVKTDVLGTYTLLEQARKQGIEKFVQISTDECYGSIEQDSFTEESPLKPNSPYSASKTSADLLCRSYFVTYKLPIVITRSSNNYGPYQFPEKFIPTVILNAIRNKSIPVYGDGKNVRDWIYVQDNCEGIDLVIQKGKVGEVYNIGGENEWHNIDVCSFILRELGKSKELITFVKDRPGHDRRYSLVCDKVKNLGWKHRTNFEKGLRKTIRWYVENKKSSKLDPPAFLRKSPQGGRKQEGGQRLLCKKED